MPNDAADQRSVLDAHFRVDRGAGGAVPGAGTQHQVGPVEQTPGGKRARQILAGKRPPATRGSENALARSSRATAARQSAAIAASVCAIGRVTRAPNVRINTSASSSGD